MNRRSAGHERNVLVDHPNITQRRRTKSTSKLAQIFSKDSDTDRINTLLTGIEHLSITGKLAAKTAESQRRGAEHLAKWAHSSRNAAIDDVMQRTNQLFSFFADKQAQFARDYDHFLEQLKRIADTENVVREKEAQVKALTEKERKIEKEIYKGNGIFGKRKSSDVLQLRDQLDRVKSEKELAERTLSETRAEAEVIKMFRFRHGMMGIADSYRNLGTACQAIFNCHREISEMVPAISTQDVNNMFYEGIPITRESVERLRRSLDNEVPVQYDPPSARRRSEPNRPRRNGPSAGFHSPPPPYTPTAPTLSMLDSSTQPPVTGNNETPRATRTRSTPRARSGQLRHSQVILPSRELSSSSEDSFSNNNQPPSSRLYPSLSFNSTDSPSTNPCPLKEFGLVPNRPAYTVN